MDLNSLVRFVNGLHLPNARNRQSPSKIFCIGFHKTGTSSVGELLGWMGYRVQGNYKGRDPEFVDSLEKGNRSELMEVASKFDAFKDNPWSVCFRELDAHFPGSRFIFTCRDADDWIRSVVNHFEQQDQPWSPMRKWIYGKGRPSGHEVLYLKRYQQHTQDVLTWFAERPGDLLCVDVCDNNALTSICAFLDFEPPVEWRMPHINRRTP